MKPSFPTNYDELVQDLLTRGSFTFKIKIENEKKFLRALNRCRQERFLRAHLDSIFGRIKWFFYGIYTTVLTEFDFRNDREGSSALNYFSIAYDYISSVEGGDSNETTQTITYIART